MLSLIYTSHATVNFSQPQLVALLEHCRQSNEASGITGMLLHDERNNFIQVIEGPEQVVEALYEKIKDDKRHDTVLCLGKREIPEREFPEWKMGFRKLSSEQLTDFPGYSDFLNNNAEQYLSEHPSFALSMLTFFRDKH